MSAVKRIYVEKKAPYAGKAKELKAEIKGYLGIKSVEDVRIFIRYDVENVSDEVFENARAAYIKAKAAEKTDITENGFFIEEPNEHFFQNRVMYDKEKWFYYSAPY